MSSKLMHPFCVLGILSKYSDEDNILTQPDILKILKNEYNCPITRKTFYHSISILLSNGYDIDTYADNRKGYYLKTRPFSEEQALFFCTMMEGTSEISKEDKEKTKETKRGNTKWSTGSLLQILQNERYCGDVLARKTYTPNYLDHKSRKNKKDRNQYLKRDHHDPIISRDDFIAVQKMIRNAKHKDNYGFLPQLTVIDNGLLNGYIPINPRWAGFSADDYNIAFNAIHPEKFSSHPQNYEAKPGAFDLRGYEIARAQFFSGNRHVSVSISLERLSFSKESISKLNNVMFIELLINPEEKMLAVRTAKKENRNHMQWARESNKSILPKQISGTAFLPVLFDLFGWNYDSKYKILGNCFSKNNESVLLFKAKDAEILLPAKRIGENNNRSTKKHIRAFPTEWIDDFGSEYYARMQEEKNISSIENWDTRNNGVPYKDPDLNTTEKEDIERILAPIISHKEAHSE